MNTKIICLLALFIVITIPMNAQINMPKTKTAKNIQLKKGNGVMVAPLLYDGVIYQKIDGSYAIGLANGAGYCCFKTAKEALNGTRQPQKLIFVKGGNIGSVFDQKTNKRIAGATLIFRKENNQGTYYESSNTMGAYKIGLPPGRYKVSVKREGYESYTTSQGFEVVNEKYETSNFYLTKKADSTRGSFPRVTKNNN